jgi:hypothetical protein
MKANNVLVKKGYTFFEDSYYLTYNKDISKNVFTQIKVSIDDLTVTCTRYVLHEDGYHEYPMILTEEIVKAILNVINDAKGKRNKDEKEN